MPVKQINNFINDVTQSEFKNYAHFFEQKISGKSYFGVDISGNKEDLLVNETGFNNLWVNENIKIIFDKSTINIMEFVCLTCVIINETGGKFAPVSEIVGLPDFPGISYAFNEINGTKKSYNTLPGNKTAFELFNDINYNNVNGAKANNIYKNTTDITWKGKIYPAGVNTSTKIAENGYIIEADFYKFRGRGLIQTTGRANYLKIIDFILKYTGSDPVIIQYKNLWLPYKNLDIIATISTNADWDILFKKTNFIIACKGINIHAKAAGSYHLFDNLSTYTPDTLTTKIFNYGLAVGGVKKYANLFGNRVMQTLNSMGYS